MQVVSLSPRQGVNVYQIVEAVEVGQLTTSAYLKTLAKIVPSLRSSVASAGDRHAACSMSAASCMVPSTSAPVDQRRCRVQLAKGGKGVGGKTGILATSLGCDLRDRGSTGGWGCGKCVGMRSV